MAAPLSPAWFVRARELVADLPVRPGLGCRAQFRTEGASWHLVIDEGQVTSWDLGEIDDPTIILRMPRDAALEAHQPDSDGTAVLAACAVVEPDGTETLPSPLDVLLVRGFDDLAEIPGADLTIQFHISDGPFGAVDCWWRFESGRSVASELSTARDPDVEIWVSFSAFQRVRAGELTLLDALSEGARVVGEEGPLMLYAGLQESPEFQAAVRACGPSGFVFRVIGTVRADPVFRSALVELSA
jgi:hypothetical protein